MDQLMQYAQQLPIEVQQLDEAHQLGSLTAFYRRTILNPLVRLVGWILLLLLLIGPIAIEWHFFGDQISQAFSNADWLPILTFALFDLIWYVIIIGFTITLQQHRNDRAYVFTNGIITVVGKQSVVYRWDQLQTIWRGTKDNEGGINTNTLRLRKTDGTEIKSSQFPGVQHASELCDTIEHEFVRLNLPAAIDIFRSGMPLTFGKLTISLSGVDKSKGEILPWSQVTHFDVTKRDITIRKEGRKHLGWFHAFIPDVPNSCLLRELVAHIRSNQSY